MSEKFTIYQAGNSFFSNESEAFSLASKSFFGEIKNGKVIYSVFEAVYLQEKGKAKIESKNERNISRLKHGKEYIVFRDLRDKGHIVKEGLKFGTDFRVYEKNNIPGKNHARYLLYILNSSKINTKDFTAKARVAHSTAKALLLAMVDSEEDVNYYEASWKSIL